MGRTRLKNNPNFNDKNIYNKTCLRIYIYYDYFVNFNENKSQMFVNKLDKAMVLYFKILES